jgi:hypothetical protein
MLYNNQLVRFYRDGSVRYWNECYTVRVSKVEGMSKIPSDFPEDAIKVLFALGWDFS